jgi:hypothetical protein
VRWSARDVSTPKLGFSQKGAFLPRRTQKDSLQANFFGSANYRIFQKEPVAIAHKRGFEDRGEKRDPKIAKIVGFAAA